jgi:V8-like Glu-specific endopeptidase
MISRCLSLALLCLASLSLSVNSQINSVDGCDGCQLSLDPVCSTYGVTFMNLCLASCQGVPVVSTGACAGTYDFARSPGNAYYEQEDDLVWSETFEKYIADGFFFTGKIPTSSNGRHPQAKLTITPRIKQDPFGTMTPRAGVISTRAVRLTPEGHVYVAANATYAKFEASRTRAADHSSTDAMYAVPSSAQGQKEDNRVPEHNTLDYPYAAMGQLSYQGGGHSYVCTGSFVSAHDVLTAAHCVYNSRSGVAYTNWLFTPALNGSMSAMAGLNKYDYVTIYQNYMTDGSDVNYWDMAVIRMKTSYSQWMNLGLVGSSSATLPLVQTCGYPGDKGTIYNCELWCCNCSATAHQSHADGMLYTDACYTYSGQSGAPLYVPGNSSSVLGVLSGGPASQNWVNYWTPMDATHRMSVSKWISTVPSEAPTALPEQELPKVAAAAADPPKAAKAFNPFLASLLASPPFLETRLPCRKGCDCSHHPSLTVSARLVSYAGMGALLLVMLLA